MQRVLVIVLKELSMKQRLLLAYLLSVRDDKSLVMRVQWVLPCASFCLFVVEEDVIAVLVL